MPLLQKNGTPSSSFLAPPSSHGLSTTVLFLYWQIGHVQCELCELLSMEGEAVAGLVTVTSFLKGANARSSKVTQCSAGLAHKHHISLRTGGGSQNSEE